MRILTTIEEGLLDQLDTRTGCADYAYRNQQRIDRYTESLQRQGSGASSRPTGWEVFSECAGAAVIVGIALFAIFAWWRIEAAEPRAVEIECTYTWTPDARYVEVCE